MASGWVFTQLGGLIGGRGVYGKPGVTAQGLFVAAVVGGTISRVTGGKFSNGTAYGAFFYVAGGGAPEDRVENNGIYDKKEDKNRALNREKAKDIFKYKCEEEGQCEPGLNFYGFSENEQSDFMSFLQNEANNSAKYDTEMINTLLDVIQNGTDNG